ncbi:hypothetical protein DPMN_012065 [Dreissena polymorpha]|uniref:Uncharacterized protein n=1 Tax=Dreissena polymorpha TaxID=45954 RepID=A0A9D4S2G8_DREPO|nr:hypothetical protein DPMN_012065 [Dreissena polymorpha]
MLCIDRSKACSITRKTAHPLAAMFIDRSRPFANSSETIKLPPPGSHETNVLTKFHENLAKNVTSRVEICPAHWRPCFSTIWTIFELVRDINKTNVLSNFHDDWAKILTSSVFTRKTAPPTGVHDFQQTRTTFELNQHIIKTNILTNFQLHRQNLCVTFELDQHIIKTNILTKLHEDWARNVTSTVFELDRNLIGTNLLTKFHEDRTINVYSRVFTNKCGRTDRRRTKTGHKCSPEQSGELTIYRSETPAAGAVLNFH